MIEFCEICMGADLAEQEGGTFECLECGERYDAHGKRLPAEDGSLRESLSTESASEIIVRRYCDGDLEGTRRLFYHIAQTVPLTIVARLCGVLTDLSYLPLLSGHRSGYVPVYSALGIFVEWVQEANAPASETIDALISGIEAFHEAYQAAYSVWVSDYRACLTCGGPDALILGHTPEEAALWLAQTRCGHDVAINDAIQFIAMLVSQGNQITHEQVTAIMDDADLSSVYNRYPFHESALDFIERADGREPVCVGEGLSDTEIRDRARAAWRSDDFYGSIAHYLALSKGLDFDEDADLDPETGLVILLSEADARSEATSSSIVAMEEDITRLMLAGRFQCPRVGDDDGMRQRRFLRDAVKLWCDRVEAHAKASLAHSAEGVLTEPAHRTATAELEVCARLRERADELFYL